MVKFHYSSQLPGWRFYAGLFRTGIALGLSSDGEGYAEVFCGEFSIDCDTSDGRFYIQGSIGDFAWVGLGFDGRRFNWGAGI